MTVRMNCYADKFVYLSRPAGDKCLDLAYWKLAKPVFIQTRATLFFFDVNNGLSLLLEGMADGIG